MNNPKIFSTSVDHIPVIWVEPENFTAPPHLVIWLDGLTGNKERMQPYLATLAASGFVAVSFDAFQHGERATERPEEFISRIFYDAFNPLTHLESFSLLPEITFECGAQDSLVPPDGALRFQEALNGMYKQVANRLRVNLHENAGQDPTIPKMWQNCLEWFINYREL
jgi:hypothetical protein